MIRLIYIALVFLPFVPHAAAAQSVSDDPYSPRNSVTYLSSDLVKRVARDQALDTALRRNAAATLPMGDVRFGGAPRLAFHRTIGLLVEGGVLARFLLDRSSNDLVSTDWVILGLVTGAVALPPRIGDQLCHDAPLCDVSFGAGVRHHSAHTGDEFFAAEKLRTGTYSRDGFVGRAELRTPRVGARFEVDDAVRSWGAPAGTAVSAEIWLKPLSSCDARLGLIRRDIPGTTSSYAALYAALPFRLLTQPLEIRARWTRGATPIGQLYGTEERTIGVELVVLN